MITSNTRSKLFRGHKSISLHPSSLNATSKGTMCYLKKNWIPKLTKVLLMELKCSLGRYSFSQSTTCMYHCNIWYIDIVPPINRQPKHLLNFLTQSTLNDTLLLSISIDRTNGISEYCHLTNGWWSRGQLQPMLRVSTKVKSTCGQLYYTQDQVSMRETRCFVYYVVAFLVLEAGVKNMVFHNWRSYQAKLLSRSQQLSNGDINRKIFFLKLVHFSVQQSIGGYSKITLMGEGFILLTRGYGFMGG